MAAHPGRRRFVTVDLAGEHDDAAFMAWIEQLISKRRLSNEIRAGLRLRWALSQQPLGDLILPQLLNPASASPGGGPRPPVQPPEVADAGAGHRPSASLEGEEPAGPVLGPPQGESGSVDDAPASPAVQDKLRKLIGEF